MERIGWASQSVYVILGLAAAALLLLALSLRRSPAVPADVASARLETVEATLRSPKASLLAIGVLLWGCIGIGLALHALLSPYPIFSGRLALQGTFRIGGIACLLALPLAWLFFRTAGRKADEKTPT